MRRPLALSSRRPASPSIRHGEPCAAVHNNCSGKHAGMLALARQLGADPHGYVTARSSGAAPIAKTMGELCDVDLDAAALRHRRLLGADLGHSAEEPGAGLCPLLRPRHSPPPAASSRRCARIPSWWRARAISTRSSWRPCRASSSRPGPRASTAPAFRMPASASRSRSTMAPSRASEVGHRLRAGGARCVDGGGEGRARALPPP